MPNISAANRQDIDAVITLLESCGLPAQDLTPEHMDSFLTLWEDEALIGCAGLEVYESAALLRSVALRGDRRGQGHGVQLLEQIEANARARKVQSVYLLTTTAEVFFARHGYNRTDREAAPPAIQQTGEFQTMCPSTAVCMYKNLR